MDASQILLILISVRFGQSDDPLLRTLVFGHAASWGQYQVGGATYWQTLQSISTKSMERWVYFVEAESLFLSVS
jgi:hypothetical protein